MNCNSARQKTDCFSWMKLMNQSYFKKMSLRSANSQIKSLKIKKHPRFVQLLLPNIVTKKSRLSTHKLHNSIQAYAKEDKTAKCA